MNNKKLEKLGTRAWIFAKRVFESDEFKEKAQEFRDKFEITECFKEYSDASTWFLSLYYESLDQIDIAKRSDLRTIARRFESDGKILPSDSSLLENDRNIRIIDAWFSMEDIRIRHALPPTWGKGILTMLLTNDINKVSINPGISVGVLPSGMDYNDQLQIVINRFTTRNDINEAWNMVIKPMKKSLWGTDSSDAAVPAYKKYKRAADMRKKGKKDSEIADKMNITTGEVSIYIRRYYISIGINSKRAHLL